MIVDCSAMVLITVVCPMRSEFEAKSDGGAGMLGGFTEGGAGRLEKIPVWLPNTPVA